MYIRKDVKTAVEVSKALVLKIQDLLKEANVLFLLPGGSAANVGVEAVKLLGAHQNILLCSLTDERYGAVDHNNSNTAMLSSVGLPSEQGFLPVLTNTSLEQTANNWAYKLNDCITNGYKIVALFGIGQDGHIAGLKPGYTFSTNKLVVSYKAADFTRISIGPAFFKHIDCAFLYAHGPTKAAVLQNLHAHTSTLIMPAQLIKDTKQYFVYYCNS